MCSGRTICSALNRRSLAVSTGPAANGNFDHGGSGVDPLDASAIMVPLDHPIRERRLDPAKHVTPPSPRYTTGG